MNSSPSYADLVEAGFPLDVLVQKANQVVTMSSEADDLAPSGHSILLFDDYLVSHPGHVEGGGAAMYWSLDTRLLDAWSCEDSC